MKGNRIKIILVIALLFLFIVNIDKINAQLLPDNAAFISSAQIIQTKTGIAPFDSNDEPGNDSSQDNDIVRAFDQITWTIENTFMINNGEEDSYTGGTIYVEAILPDNCKDVVHWDLDSMKWAGNTAKVSTDGLTFTASYAMNETEITIPGKQNLSFVLKVDGASNGLEIEPEFKLWLNGNTDKVSVKSKKITVSSRSAYNIKLVRNGSISTETTIADDNGNEVKGRVYAYAALLQLYNDSADKGIKGLEYATGDITFDLDMTLRRINLSTKEEEDVTSTFTPIIYNYSLDGSRTNTFDKTRNNINFYRGAYYPYGIRNKFNVVSQATLETSIYKSGNYTLTQNGSNVKVNVSDYAYDGYFPVRDYSSTQGTIKYTDNIANFSGLYFEVFVPYDTETANNYTYYLDITDSNMNINSVSGTQTTQQEIDTDDYSSVQHVVYRKGSFWHDHYIYNSDRKMIHTAWNTGDAIGYNNQEIYLTVVAYTGNNNTESDSIYSTNILIKFDTNAFEAISDIDGNKIFKNSPFEYELYYACKKDGTAWTSVEEQQTAKIEDLDYYRTLEEVEAAGKICVGGLLETTSGVLVANGEQKGAYAGIPVRIKETANIGQTYQFTSDTRMYLEQLDRSVESMIVEGGSYTTTPIASWVTKYTKTEYDSSGQIITGTHYPSVQYGNSILIIAARSQMDVGVTQLQEGDEKINYDFGKNEYEVEYILTPSINSTVDNEASTMSGVTVIVTDILPSGLTYVANSSNMGEPEITINDDGTTTLVWKIYDCTVNEPIEPVVFRAHIDEESVDGTSYTNTAIISAPEVDIRGIGKRTATYTIQVINLASHRLYKTTSSSVIELGDNIHYQITYKNNTDGVISNFQLLDILPYNGDTRGSSFNGTYKLSSFNITRYDTNDLVIQDDSVKMYYTNDESARTLNSKSESIGSDLWTQVTSSNINDYATAVAIKGEVSSLERIVIDIYLTPEDNEQGDTYINNSLAQTNPLTDEMVSSNVISQVIHRKIEGVVWYDENSNGLMDDNEPLAQNIEMTIINSSGEQVADVYGNILSSIKTDVNGYYLFDNLPKDEYYIRIAMPNDRYGLTEKLVGINNQINSKFNEETDESDLITKLNTLDLPVLTESNVNAGLAVVYGSIELTKLDKNDSEKLIEGASFKLEKLNTDGTIDTTFETLEKTTDTTGMVIYDGLEVGKYRLTEIKAPEGYELLQSSIEVEITRSNRNIELIAQNQLKLVLPLTGEINYTEAFVVTGSVLIVLSLLVLFIRKLDIRK